MKFNKIGMGLIAFSFAAIAHADGPVYVSINDGPDEILTVISDEFAGQATLGKTCGLLPINLSCTLTLEGKITDLGSDVELSISEASSTGSLLCGGVGFNLPGAPDWSGTAPHSALPTSKTDTTAVPFTVSGIGVTTSCGNCAGSLGATFSNAGAGTFGFSGSLGYTGGGLPGACNVSGSGIVSTSGTDYKVWHN